ncbi:MAG TPA: hypothetical protein PKM25_10980 [Candidatus Ozemobacteraceae bacterium]|nr:hypothetical protein [Candidatus Ozemobacteraceae bacterium]
MPYGSQLNGRGWGIVVLLILAGLCMTPVTAGEEALDLAGIAKILTEAETFQRMAIPKGLLSKKGPFEKGDYDPNGFLALFPRLSLEKGRVLDFVYDLQDLGGHPIVYARPGNRASFAGLAEFRKEYPRRYFLGDDVRFDPFYLGSIRTDGTPDGFLQLAMMVMRGEQFYIWWHAAYSILWPVMNRETLDDIARIFPQDQRKRVGEVDFTPHVKMNTESVTVEYVVFNAWQGFKRIIWTVGREFPHRFIKVDEKILLPYKSPVQF